MCWDEPDLTTVGVGGERVSNSNLVCERAKGGRRDQSDQGRETSAFGAFVRKRVRLRHTIRNVGAHRLLLDYGHKHADTDTSPSTAQIMAGTAAMFTVRRCTTPLYVLAATAAGSAVNSLSQWYVVRAVVAACSHMYGSSSTV